MNTAPRDRRPSGLPPGMPTESYAARVAREESEAVTVTEEWLNSHVPGPTTSSEEEVMHVCDAGCRDHAEASRVQALGEVEQLLAFRWRDAWKDWRGLVDKGAPVDTASIAWGRQAEALDAAEVVAAMRGPGGVESLRSHLWDDIQAGGV